MMDSFVNICLQDMQWILCVLFTLTQTHGSAINIFGSLHYLALCMPGSGVWCLIFAVIYCIFTIFSFLLQMYICGCLLMGTLSILLFLENASLLYHVYVAMTVFLWTHIFSNFTFLKAVWRYIAGRKFIYILKPLAYSAVSICILEFLVMMPCMLSLSSHQLH